jgi:hypothetical protein
VGWLPVRAICSETAGSNILRVMSSCCSWRWSSSVSWDSQILALAAAALFGRGVVKDDAPGEW